MSATHLARHLSEVLDAVEHRGESFTIERHGKPIARIAAPAKTTGRELREHFERKAPDPDFADDLERIHRELNRPVLPRDPWED